VAAMTAASEPVAVARATARIPDLRSLDAVPDFSECTTSASLAGDLSDHDERQSAA
jgi:hypothetical protein